MLASTGVPTKEDLNKVFPSEERLAKGPVVVVECFQEIPCNPCYTACNRNAIKEFKDINHLPTVDHDVCNGCSLCVANCPGLAIMVVDMTYSKDEALLKIPYEFLPLPEEGDVVKGLDREGKEIDDVRIVKILNTKALDRTPIIAIAVKKEHVRIIRNIQVDDKTFSKVSCCGEATAENVEEMSKETVVCRCSDVTLEDIRELIGKGYTTFDEIKRISRVGMGPCQGRTCGQIILRELAQITGTSIEKLMLGTYRPPVKSMKLGEIVEAALGGEAHD
ncbi:(2Fe-2S)-binding protein [Natronincola ferrireducens]|uniref:4Fe-4S binding domain-containing protein n=1 Tax=Natronincola ferrireducens TaxID=393762 RepID=A0A1G8YGK8_9FIRM|nr:(2Fe-2S)-binding protein [Natronincola ferrireducens]SDK01200.1 4Fe-4S binding domain-containing protein [Natronincola ferrireducens]